MAGDPAIRLASRALDVRERPIAVLLLPRALEQFILREQAEDLLRAEGVVAVEPARMPYGAFGRLPLGMADALGASQARRLKLKGDFRTIVLLHPLQLSLCRALRARYRDAELWYGRWDRYEHAYDANARMRERLELLHAEAAERAAFVFVASDALVEIERADGREAALVGLAAGTIPAPDPARAVVAVSLGHLGHRVDWALLRAVAERMPDLVVLLVGAAHPDELGDDADFAACRSLANLVWLGALDDEAAARMILCDDCGIVPFKREPFNDAGLPYRILKAAPLARRSITPPRRGVLTWERAVVRADGPDAWVEALRAEAGRRCTPDEQLRAWALAQTPARVNQPLWERLSTLGIV